MDTPFEIYMASVKWASEGTVRFFNHSNQPLKVEYENNEFSVDVPSYARLEQFDAQFAIKTNDECIIMSRDPQSTLKLFSYKDPTTGAEWWFEAGKWKKSKSGEYYHDALTFHAPGGYVTVKIGEHKCRVNTYYPVDDVPFQGMLDEVIDTCWQVAEDKQSYINATRLSEKIVANDPIVESCRRFLESCEEIIRQPLFELREEQQEQDYRKLKPNRRTFMELATKGERRCMTGRGHSITYNTPENRAVAAMVDRVTKMIYHHISATRSKTNILERRRAALRERLDSLENVIKENREPIDRSHIDSLISDLESIVFQQADEVSRCRQSDKAVKVVVVKTKTRKEDDDVCWGRAGKHTISGDSDGTDDIMIIDPHHRLLENSIYLVAGKIIYERRKDKRGKYYLKTTIEHTNMLEPYRGYELAQLKSKREKLSASNWLHELNPTEIEELHKNADSLRQKINNMRETAETSKDRIKILISIFERLCRIIQEWKRLGVVEDPHFVPSITFIQNSAYSRTLNAFQQIEESSGINSEVYEKLITLEEWGLLDRPNVYERWCLIKIIQVLTEEYSLVPETNIAIWLLNYCTGKKISDSSISFFRKDCGLKAELKCQHKLPNGKEPDFQLTFRWSNENVTLVLDAKSCNFVPKTNENESNIWMYLSDCLRDLVVVKDYGHITNKDHSEKGLVFVLHSSSNCLDTVYSGFDWASSSSYGGSISFPEWEQTFPNHQHGAVRILPGDTEALHRLFGLALQYFAGNVQKENQTFLCPVCGGLITKDDTYDGKPCIDIKCTNAGYSKYWIKCKHCLHFFVASHCFCGNNLWKNLEWTYHDRDPEDSYNVRCPSCGLFYVQPDSNTE